ncbi:MAG: HPr family phosphocarrier protein [Clostridia bacterium]|nr:HPr family phosphocarrier protein [Clostridia bacterium]
MKKEFVVNDPLGLHARPAGVIVKEAQRYESEVTLTVQSSGKSASAKGLFALLGLEVRQGDILLLAADGKDEDKALRGVGAVIEERLGAQA